MTDVIWRTKNSKNVDDFVTEGVVRVAKFEFEVKIVNITMAEKMRA